MTEQNLTELEQRYLMGTYRRLPVTMVEGRGVTVRDAEGREYLDLVAGIAVNALGHAHPAVAAAVADQAGRLIHTSNLYYTEPQVALARRLVELSFPSRVFFANSAAEASRCWLEKPASDKSMSVRTGTDPVMPEYSFWASLLMISLAISACPARIPVRMLRKCPSSLTIAFVMSSQVKPLYHKDCKGLQPTQVKIVCQVWYSRRSSRS